MEQITITANLLIMRKLMQASEATLVEYLGGQPFNERTIQEIFIEASRDKYRTRLIHEMLRIGLKAEVIASIFDIKVETIYYHSRKPKDDHFSLHSLSLTSYSEMDWRTRKMLIGGHRKKLTSITD